MYLDPELLPMLSIVFFIMLGTLIALVLSWRDHRQRDEE